MSSSFGFDMSARPSPPSAARRRRASPRAASAARGGAGKRVDALEVLLRATRRAGTRPSRGSRALSSARTGVGSRGRSDALADPVARRAGGDVLPSKLTLPCAAARSRGSSSASSTCPTRSRRGDRRAPRAHLEVQPLQDVDRPVERVDRVELEERLGRRGSVLSSTAVSLISSPPPSSRDTPRRPSGRSRPARTSPRRS